MIIETNEPKKQQICKVASENSYFIFRDPESLQKNSSFISLKNVEQNNRNGIIEVKYKIKENQMDNLKTLENQEIKYEGKEFSLRNHLVALKKQSDGSYKIYPITNFIKFNKVFNNDVKLKIQDKEEIERNTLFNDEDNKVSFKINNN